MAKGIEDDEDNEFERLANCFSHICRMLYRNKTLEQAPLLKPLNFLARVFLESVPMCT